MSVLGSVLMTWLVRVVGSNPIGRAVLVAIVVIGGVCWIQERMSAGRVAASEAGASQNGERRRDSDGSS